MAQDVLPVSSEIGDKQQLASPDSGQKAALPGEHSVRFETEL